MDDIWVILGSIVLMVLSSFSSAKKKKGVNTSSVDTDEDAQDSVFDEEFIPMEDSFDGQRQDINNIDEEKFDAKVDFYPTREREVVNDIIVEEPKDDILKDGESEKVEFDLRKAIIYSTILENPYIKTEKK
ncbi:MAG: hypothetical protein IKD33_07015 [Bacteroidales bacterium]|nr:hypothetical protein [Bacteroidales bacterium]